MVSTMFVLRIFVTFFTTDQASKKNPFPCPTTYRAALTHYVDINSLPRTHVLRELAEHASNPDEKEMIMKMTAPSDEGKVSH